MLKKKLTKQEIHGIIQKYKNIPLSNDDIMNLVDGKANIIRYSDMHKIRNIDDLLYPYNACVILYEAKPRDGHWCVLTKHGNNVEFMDSYGEMFDKQLDYIDPDFKIRSNQDKPYLGYLLLNCPYDVSYNEHKFQKLSRDVKDCGRWSALRILFKNLELKDFKDLFYGPYSDDIATAVTYDRSQLK